MHFARVFPRPSTQEARERKKSNHSITSCFHYFSYFCLFSFRLVRLRIRRVFISIRLVFQFADTSEEKATTKNQNFIENKNSTRQDNECIPVWMSKDYKNHVHARENGITWKFFFLLFQFYFSFLVFFSSSFRDVRAFSVLFRAILLFLFSINTIIFCKERETMIRLSRNRFVFVWFHILLLTAFFLCATLIFVWTTGNNKVFYGSFIG